MDCKYCGQPLKDGARFCSNCGALNDVDTSSASSSFPTTSKSFGAAKKLKNNVSKTKTPFFWLSKLAIVAAIICFIMPFMEIKFASKKGFDIGNVEMTGRELVLGLDGDKTSGDTSSNSKLINEKIVLAAVLAIAAIVMNRKCAAIPAAISSIFILAFINGADGDYTVMDKKIKDWNDLVTLEIKPGGYIVLALMIIATVLAAIDYYKRVKMAKDETEFY